MSAGSGGGYKPTLFDRRGPEAAHFLQAVSSLIIPIVAGAFTGAALAVRRDFSPALIALSTLGGSLTFTVWWWFFVTRLSYGAGRTFSEFIQPSAAGSYERQYSREDALPRVARKDDIYASNRLVDLYLAWPGHETKGLSELRRLIDTYPETDVAARARAGLVNLKGQLGIAE